MAEQEDVSVPKKEETVEEVPKASNYCSGTWKCVACYCSMKQSMRKENALIQKAARKAKKSQRNKEREEKRKALEAKSKAKDDDKKEEKSESEKVKIAEEKPKAEKPLYRLSENVPKTMRA